MADSQDGQHPQRGQDGQHPQDGQDGQDGQQLPAELAAALRRATAGTLGAFQSLRAAVREHVHSERSRGASLSEIDDDLRSMIDLAGLDVGDGARSAQHIDEVRAQVLRWSESFYSRSN